MKTRVVPEKIVMEVDDDELRHQHLISQKLNGLGSSLHHFAQNVESMTPEEGRKAISDMLENYEDINKFFSKLREDLKDLK